MGEVYRARDPKLQRDVAIKILPQMFEADADRLARFEREAQILAALNHPNIAQIYGLEQTGAAPALVMELVDGRTLAELMKTRGPGSGRARSVEAGLSGQPAVPLDPASGWTIRDRLEIARQVADALEAAHELAIHRDLKPGNIKVRSDGGCSFRRDEALMAVDVDASGSDIHFGAERKLFDWDVALEYAPGPGVSSTRCSPFPAQVCRAASSSEPAGSRRSHAG
jgi:serine/threonine protein kinase